MKIGIIGANGKAGRCIMREAACRGHDVTAIVRNHETILDSGYKVKEKDLFSLTADDLKPFDAVVSAFGLPFGGDHPENAYQKAYQHLIKLFKELPDTRLFVVGGAASLYTDEARTKKLLGTFPREMRKDPEDMAKVYELLKESGIQYTFFSPAAVFDHKGLPTKNYKLGTDVMIQNDKGESYISYEDYGYAMVDEIEKGQFIGARFTAVGEKRYREDPSNYGI